MRVDVPQMVEQGALDHGKTTIYDRGDDPISGALAIQAWSIGELDKRSRPCGRPFPSGERLVPLLVQRPGTPPSGSKRELALADPMGQLEAGQRDGRRPERLEPEHGLASALNGAMDLLDDVVEVRTVAHQNILPAEVLSPEQPQPQVARGVSVQSNLLRPAARLPAKAVRKNDCVASNPPYSAAAASPRSCLSYQQLDRGSTAGL